MSDDPNPQPEIVVDSTGLITVDDDAASEVGKDGKPFDAERAQHTIETLRAEVRQARKAERELEKVQARLKEIDDAQKSELELAKDRAAELEAKIAAQADRQRNLNTRLAANALAGELGINDPDLALAAVSDLEYDDDGEPINLREALEAACEKHPALKTPVKTPKPPLDGGKGNTDGPGPELNAQQREWAGKLGMTVDEYAAYMEVKDLDDFSRVREAAKA